MPEVPLVVMSAAFGEGAIKMTSAAIGLLKGVGAGPDLVKVKKSRKMRASKGKMRGHRFRQRRGPLLVYNPDEDGKELVRAFRNIPRRRDIIGLPAQPAPAGSGRPPRMVHHLDVIGLCHA